MNKLLEKINFKRVVIIYLILLILVLSFISIFLGYTYKDKIKVLYNYHKLTEVFKEDYNKNNLEDKINNLSKSSNDIIDVVILNKNNIIYTTNNFYKNELTSINNTNNYYTDFNNIYVLDTKEEFILDLFNIKKENKNDYYDNFKITNEDKYTINYLENKYTNEKIIIVSKISYIKDIHKYLKISLAILMLFFMLYWLIVALMIYQNALNLKINAYLWGGITLLTNFIGVIIYLIYIKNRKVCKNCNISISKSDKYCKNCGEKI